MYVQNGEILRRSADGQSAAELLKVPDHASQGAMALLRTALQEWFDAFRELEWELGVDLQEVLASKPADALAPQWWLVSAEKEPALLTERTGWVARAPQAIVWDRPIGGWWVERSARGAPELCSKATVVCGAPVNGQSFVSFVEGGSESFQYQYL